MRLMRDLVGDILSGRYRLITRVAGGGMGDVYRGHDLLLDRSVAVKVLQPSLAADPQLVARFKQEARAAARLTHPNVVSVYDWGSSDDQTYYMVMEYVPGTDLRDLLVSRGALQAGQTVDIMASVCEALSAAHAGGLIHRDVKPENILIARDGTVKVADFGIAIVADVDPTSPGGWMPGTLRYLSPEQAGGREATAASDVWAAGAVLAEALTGQPPLIGSGADLLRRRAVETPVPPSMFDAAIPRDLDGIVMRACAVDPQERYQDAADMAADLRRVSVRSLPDSPPVEELLYELTNEVVLPDLDSTEMLSKREFRRSHRSRRAKVLRALVAAVLLLLAAAGATRAATALFGPEMARVPSLAGLSRNEAVARAEDAGFVVEISSKRKHTRARKGRVLGQFPPSGEIEQGSTITLYLSAGLPRHPVPSLIGLELVKARRRLQARGLVVGEVTERFSDEAAGSIVAQEPETGRLRWGRPVHIVISKGPKPIPIPNVFGQTADDAVATLQELGFQVATTEVFDDKVAAGKVIATEPVPGTRVPKGTTIAVTVSKGPKLRTFKMPDVRGRAVNDARAMLEKLGLVVEIVQSCGSGGKNVVETDPIAGTKVTEGDNAALFVC